MKGGFTELCLHTASRLGLADKLKSALDARVAEIDKQDSEGKTPLHHAAAANQEDCVEILLEKGASVTLQDNAGNTALHCSCEAGAPMICYQVATRGPGTLPLVKNAAGKTPVDLAAATERGEVLNALLLACSGQGGSEALSSMQQLLKNGAVCDTWAPNGSSALMLAAAIDCTAGVQLLLENGATIELQDALGRTALMFAAGNDATSVLSKLVEAGASVSIRDRRGRNVMDYAVEGSVARKVLQEHLQQLESKASQLQAALLAEFCDDDPKSQAAQGKAKKSKKKKGSKVKKTLAPAAVTAAVPDVVVPQAAVLTAVEKAVDKEEAKTASDATASPTEECTDKQGDHSSLIAAATSQPSTQSSTPSELCTAASNSLDGDMSMDDRSPSPPGSPGGWCKVSKPTRQHSKPLAVLEAQVQQQQHSSKPVGGGLQQLRAQCQQQQQQACSSSQGRGNRFEEGSLDAGSRVRRCPSSGSVASTSSGESQDTDASRLSGSERSVLRPTLHQAALSGQQTGLPCTSVGLAGNKTAADVGPWAAAAAVEKQNARSLLPSTAAWAAPRATPAVQAAPTWAEVTESGSSSGKPAATSRDAADISQPSSLPSAEAELSEVSKDGPRPAAAPSDGAAAGADIAAELAMLREQVAQLQQTQKDAEIRHRQELAAVLEDAVQHEAMAVQQAVSAERMNCIVRFTSFLQHSGSTLCASFPDIFGSAGALSAPHSQDGVLLGDFNSTLDGHLHGCASHQQQQQHLDLCSGVGSNGRGGGARGGMGAFESLPSAAANDRVGLPQIPPSALASLAFPPVGPPGRYPAVAGSKASSVQQGSGMGLEVFGSLLDSGPSSSFCFHDLEHRLRGEYQGNHSAFVVPAASEPISPMSASLLSSSLNLSLNTGI